MQNFGLKYKKSSNSRLLTFPAFGLTNSTVKVNNAGVSFNGLRENSVEHAETVIKTNFYGPKLLTEALLPVFRCSNSKSRILNISSRLGSLSVSEN
ncbi:unnamed protein product [Thlaspi arvense]|uniref:Uncharacterized protein n=1 Tax=Thlaspi arvense TaxID=13288 RepID=A0AAU9RWZ3_THLAR|nr:unnamed protein product [Thlaspi arvense]